MPHWKDDRDMVTREKHKAGADGIELTRRTVGSAMVVHRRGAMTTAAQALAMTVAEDPEHDLVVVDLPAELPIAVWEVVADVLPRRRRGIRLVMGGRSRETTAMAGQWLSERLGRTVIAPDGQLVSGAGGSLFVNSGRGSGWVRFHPGRAPRWDSKRFPRPSWDSTATSETAQTSSRGVVEPLPGGLWVRPSGFDRSQWRQRQQLITTMVPQQDILTVVLGSPAGPMLSMDDVARLWMRLPGVDPRDVRFTQFGPIALPPGSALGQALADLLGVPTACYTGLPVGDVADPDVVTVSPDSRPGWRSLARELGYQPGKPGAEPEPPVLISHLRPLADLPEAGPAVYWFATDAVVEVIASGLLVRGPAESGNARAIRLLPPDAGVLNLAYDADDDTAMARMRYLAEDLLGQLDHGIRQVSRLIPAITLLSAGAQATIAGPARVAVPAGALLSDGEVTAPALAESTPTTRFAPATPEEFTPAQPSRFRLESVAVAATPTIVPAPVAPAVPLAVESVADIPAQPPAPQSVDVRPQPVPSSDAAALLPARGMTEERSWLRNALGAEYGTMSNSMARVLSEHPGLQGALSRSEDAVLTDAVAVRLYLSERGVAIDEALRTGAVGPHVPLARCVVAGLSRLPSHRGPAVLRAQVTPAHVAYYRAHPVVTEWGFLNALVEPCAGLPGDTDVLIWSMTARRTRLLEPGDDHPADRVLFVPGTSFKVLDLTEPAARAPGLLLMRELTAAEVDEKGQVDPNGVPLDELARSSLRRELDRWTDATPTRRTDRRSAPRFGSLPGLVCRPVGVNP
jgi:hypothetical protein